MFQIPWIPWALNRNHPALGRALYILVPCCASALVILLDRLKRAGRRNISVHPTKDIKTQRILQSSTVVLMLFVLFTCAINAPQSQWVASLEPSSSVILSQVQLWVHLVQPLQHPVPVAVPKVSQAWFSLIFCFGFLRMRARTCMHNHEEKWRQVRQNHSSRQIAKYSQRSCVLVLPRNYLRKSWFQTFRRNINGPRGR